MSQHEMHLHKVRCKRRKRVSDDTHIRVEYVFTLCGKWVVKRFAIREDRLMVTSAEVCDECRAERSLGSIYGVSPVATE